MTTFTQHRVSRRGLIRATGVGAAGLGAAALIGCTSSSPPAAGTPAAGGTNAPVAMTTATTMQPKAGGIFKYAASADVETLDRYKASAPTGYSLPTYFTYSRLLAFEPGVGKPASGKIAGDIVKSWEQKDETTFVMKLDPGAKFDQRQPTNGRQVDSQDVVQSWKRYEATAAERTTMANKANKDAAITDITAIDKETIQVKLAFPDALVLSQLAGTGSVWVQPVEGIEGKIDLAQNMRGSGPFYLEKYQRAVGYTFKKNPSWHGGGGRPYLDQVDVPIIPERAQTETQFRAKNLHALAVSQENIPTFAKELPDTKIVTSTPLNQGPLLGVSWADGQPWQDVRVRRAASMAMDRDSIVSVIFNPKRYEDMGIKLNSYWNTPLSAGWGQYWLDPKGKDFGPAAQYLQHNVAEAKKLMDAAGFGASKPLSTDIVFPGVYYGRDWPTRVEVFQSMLAEIGIKAVPSSIDYTEYIAKYWRGGAKFEGKTQKTGLQFPPGGAAASTALEWCISYFTAKGVSTAVADKWPQLEELVKKQRQVTDFEAQKNGVYEIQRFVTENMIVIPVGPLTESVDLVWNKLHGPGEVQGWPGGFPNATEYYNYWMESQI